MIRALHVAGMYSRRRKPGPGGERSGCFVRLLPVHQSAPCRGCGGWWGEPGGMQELDLEGEGAAALRSLALGRSFLVIYGLALPAL